MSRPNYWQRMRRNKMSRRSLLRASARVGVGAAGLALVGCGDDDDDDGQVVTQAQQQQQQQQQQAMQQQAQEQQAEQQAMQQQAQEEQAEQQAMQQQEQQQQQQAAVAQAQQAEPVERGRAIVTGIASDNLFGLDPITGAGGDEHQFVWMVYDTLVGVDSDLVPDQSRSLAEFWEIPDDLTFVFTIRPDVRFHDGTPLNAEAVKWHIERARDLDISVAAQDTQLIGEAESTDELTSPWHMDEPFAPLLRMLSDRAGMLVSPTKVMETDEFQNRQPTGAGAMVFVEEVESDRLVVKANEDYWMENSPLIDGVTMRLGVQGDQKVNGLLAGDLDIIDGPDPSQLSTIEDAGLTLKGRPSNALRRTWWNMNLEPWTNPHLRRAVNWAVNRPQINDLVSNGIHTPAHFGLIGPALGDHNPDFQGYSFNPDKVREELARAGHPDGFEYEVNTNGSVPTWVEEDQLISAQLAEFGIIRN
ncbi:MAG: ABC transporter substrate-binding protein, partial [Chloroflexi bacterium]|nr:ABC transporter substrate-binding protein [Chloroflexota bacterium]